MVTELIAGENSELLLLKEEHNPDASISNRERENYSQYDHIEIERLPVPVGDFGQLKKINVVLHNEQEGSNKTNADFFCHRYHMPLLSRRIKQNESNYCRGDLDKEQKELLSCSAEDLMKNIIPHYWSSQFSARAAIFVQKRNVDRALPDEYDSDVFEIHYKSEPLLLVPFLFIFDIDTILM